MCAAADETIKRVACRSRPGATDEGGEDINMADTGDDDDAD